MITSLVTGGAGFIGSHLCQRLTESDHKVICLDNLITGSKENIEHLLANKNFTFIDHDITSVLDISEKIDHIYNLACPASPIDYQEIPIETLTVSSTGVKNMLDLAVKNEALFLHTSTSEIYGDPLQHPQDENYFGNVNCHGIRSCYDEGKRFAESLITNYKNKFNLNTKIVRIFNTYGPKMRKSDGRVIPNFINQALSGLPITIYGQGTQTRSFCYISDMVNGIISMMEKDDFSGPVNLGNPDERSMIDLAKIIIKLVKSKSHIQYLPLPQDDPKSRCPNIALAKKKLDFSPDINLEKGLKNTIDFFKN